MTNGWVCATIDMGDRRSFLVVGHGVPVAKRPAPVREEVTSGHICSGANLPDFTRSRSPVRKALSTD
jgi:hypothetical protein